MIRERKYLLLLIYTYKRLVTKKVYIIKILWFKKSDEIKKCESQKEHSCTVGYVFIKIIKIMS